MNQPAQEQPQTSAAPPQPAGCGGRVAKGCGCAFLALLAVVTLVAGGFYWLWSGRPGEWAAIEQTITVTPPEQLEAAATRLENRLPSEMTELRAEAGKPDDRVIRIEIDDANAWLAQKLRPWAANQDAALPPQVRHVAVWTRPQDQAVVLAVDLKSSRVEQLVSATVSLEVLEDGKVRAQVTGVRAGRLPVPIDSLIEQMGVRDDPRFEELLPWIDKAMSGLTFEPVHQIDPTRQVRVTGIDVQEDAVEFEVRTEDRAE